MTTDVLLLAGVIAAVVFVSVLLVERTLRPGYNPIYHTGSELELGERGWIRKANFFVMGAGVIVFAVGVQRSLNTTSGAVLLALFGLGLIVAGMFAPDPVRAVRDGAGRHPGHPQRQTESRCRPGPCRDPLGPCLPTP